MKQFAVRIGIYVLGFFVFSIGSAMMVKSGLGVTATTALPYALNIITGLSIGCFMFLMSIVYVALEILVLRRDFQLKNFGQIGCGMLLGSFVNLSTFLLGGIGVETYLHRLLFLVAGILCIGLGLSLVINMNFLPTPAEGFALAIAQKRGVPLPKVKVAVDCATLALSLLVLVLTSNSIHNFREGSVLSALCIGASIGVFNRVLAPLYRAVYAPRRKDSCSRPVNTPSPSPLGKSF